ncbi:MAG: hypothetical protein AAF698_12990, partial [Pseudomonadota bacterium]
MTPVGDASTEVLPPALAASLEPLMRDPRVMLERGHGDLEIWTVTDAGKRLKIGGIPPSEGAG